MKNRLTLIAIALASMATLAGRAPAADSPALTLKKGDHICIIGNALADRMQHSGYLEALIYSRFTDLELVVRNLGFAGDEVATRARSEAFGTPDDWLKQEKADVILACFGYNESRKGADGLAAFKADLEKFIKATLAQDYSGRGAPRLVLVSPIAAERHPDPNFPKPGPINRDLKIYAEAMAEIAQANGVPFIDLMKPSMRAYSQADEPLTINGVHLSDDGYRALAPAMFRALFGEPTPTMDGRAFEAIRQAVNEKSELWFSRYRTIDGYNVFGGRSHLEFDGVKNRDTMQREMQMRDVMTANRDKRVWAASRGENLLIADDNLPEPITVQTNKKGDKPDGTFSFLGGEAAIERMKVPPGCKVSLFASEEQFPELVQPVQMGFDTRGRLWVASWPNYPGRTPDSKTGDRLLVFEDADNDGKADKVTPFLDDLNGPTGFQFYKDGVIVVQAPDIWFVRDTDGDGKADWKERLLNGLDSADSHHTANALALEPGGAIFLSDGVFHRTQFESAWAGSVRNIDAAIHRYEPRTGKVEVYASYGFANPHGRVFDYWGNDLITDATGNNTYFAPAFTGHLDYPDKHSELKQFWERPSRPCPGTGMISSRHFPDDWQGTFLNCNVIGFQGIYRVRVREEGSGLWGDTIEPPLMQSDDPNFRPSSVDVAPDGSIYFLDWHNPIIGHMQHHLRDPNRDHQHGRIYRITYEGRDLLKPTEIAGEPIIKLLDLLKEPEDNVRKRARIELGGRPTKDVIAATKKWLKQFDAEKIEDQHHILEGLWVFQTHNVVNEPLLKRLLRSPEPRARAQAVRTLGYWRDRVRKPLDLLRAAANDPAPRVRLEAVRVASFFQGDEAMEIAHEILKYDTDYYLDYTFKETTRQLAKTVKGVYLPKDPKALGAVIGKLSDKDLLAAEASDPVYEERLKRPGLNVNARTEALSGLAKLRHSTPAEVGAEVLKGIDLAGKKNTSAAEDIGFVVASYPPEDLAKSREAYAALASSASQVSVRRAAWAVVVAGDKEPDAAWGATEGNVDARVALIGSIGLQADSEFRAMFAPALFKALADDSTPALVQEASLRALPLLGAEHASESFGVLAARLREGRDRSIAARSLLQLPRTAWAPDQAVPVAESIRDWAKTVAEGDRSDGDYAATLQAGMEIAALAPPDQAKSLRKEIQKLTSPIFALRSVREQMRYDINRIVVEKGKPFQIVFENADMMPHNITVIEPGSREELGKLADKMAPTPDKQGRSFIPDDKRILAASKMVEPRMKETLKVKAIDKAGEYEFLCTYPEHWKSMFGKLIVVDDIEAYLATDEGSAPAPTPVPYDPSAHEHK